MASEHDITDQLRRELAETQLRLNEAVETVNAIRKGEVDGLVIDGLEGPQVFTLEGAQEPYRLLIEQMSEGALTLSRDGVILYANQTFEGMLQAPPGRVIGVAFRDFIVPADQAALAGLIAAAWDGSSRGEISIRTADGAFVPLRLGLRPLQVGAETLICAVVTDITVEKKREGELRKLTDLEARIKERTTDLAMSRLAALNMMEEAVEARQAVELVNRTLANEVTEHKQAELTLQDAQRKNMELLVELQHRAKNSFSMISSMIRVASSNDASLEPGHAFDYLEARVRSVSELYDLLYSQGSVAEVRLDDYCARVAGLLVALHGNIALKTELESVAVSVKDAAPIGLILTELLTNAVMHAFPGGRRGTVTVRLRETADCTALLEVVDNGIGLPMGFDISTDAGMGLNLIQGFAGQVHGNFEVAGDEGGTRCTLDFAIGAGKVNATPGSPS